MMSDSKIVRNVDLKSFELYFNLIKDPGRQRKDNMFIIFKMGSERFLATI